MSSRLHRRLSLAIAYPLVDGPGERDLVDVVSPCRPVKAWVVGCLTNHGPLHPAVFQGPSLLGWIGRQGSLRYEPGVSYILLAKNIYRSDYRKDVGQTIKVFCKVKSAYSYSLKGNSEALVNLWNREKRPGGVTLELAPSGHINSRT